MSVVFDPILGALRKKDGEDGADGITPHIDSTTKHWMIGDTDTGVVAEGQNGSNGRDGAGALTRLIVSGATTASAGGWYLCESDVTITLPAVTSGGVVKVSTIGSASSVTINPAGSDTIEGDSAFLLDNANNAVELIGNSGGTMWIVAEVVAN